MFEIFKEDVIILFKSLVILLLMFLVVVDISVIFVIISTFYSKDSIIFVNIGWQWILTFNIITVIPTYIYFLYVRSKNRIENNVEPNRIGF